MFIVLQGSGNLDAIHLIKKSGGGLQDSYLDEGKKLNSRPCVVICIANLDKDILGITIQTNRLVLLCNNFIHYVVCSAFFSNKD